MTATKTLARIIAREYRAAIEADGGIANLAGLRVRWTPRTHDDGYRLFTLHRDGETVATGDIEDYGAFCNVCPQS